MRSLTWNEACAMRLARNYLAEPAARGRMVTVVCGVCGIQAQMMVAAELAIGARIAEIAQQDIRAAIWEERRLVKTYGPRGTLHLLPASDLPLWMAAMRAHASLRGERWYESAGLEPKQADNLLAAIEDALDDHCLTREELADAVAARVGAWARDGLLSAWGTLLRPAAYMGRLCFGPNRGGNVTFVRADQWVREWKECDPDDALAEICRRYFATYGPATQQDFARWFALRPDEARQVLALLGEDLEEVLVDGRRAWMRAPIPIARTMSMEGSVHLLPQYDCYVIGSGQRERVVPEAARTRIRSYRRGRYEGAVGVPVVLIDGVVSGIWERRAHGKRIEICVELFVRPTTVQQQQIEAEGDRIGTFFGATANCSLGTLP